MAFEVENLFQAIDIILGQRLQDINFDKTIICTIVDDSDKKNGCYIVTDGTIKFKAYVNDATYRKDDQVRVSILNGDFNEKKFITGRYTGDEDSSPITYKSPLEGIIPITGNLVKDVGIIGLRANKNDRQEDIIRPIWHIDLKSNQEFRDLQSNGIYDTLSIKADFKTLLSHYDLVSGNYGLILRLLIQESFDNTPVYKHIVLDSSEMLGNPYSFLIYSTQAKKVDIISTGIISEMTLYVYQSINGDGEGRRFIERNGNEIPVNQKLDDILIKDIEIGFGSNVEKVTDNTLQLFTSSPPYYVYKDATDETNKKNMELLWFNKTENNEFIGFSDGLFDLEYDEIKYLTMAHKDSRLIAQVGRTDIPSDEPGLKLAADLKDAKPIMIKARDALTRDLNEILQDLQRQTYSSESISNELKKLLDTANGTLVTQWNKANQEIENWNNQYVGVLQYAYDKQYGVENASKWDSKWEVDYLQNYLDSINLALQSLRHFFNGFNDITQPSAAQSAHRGNYDLYWYRTSNKIAEIETWLNQLTNLLQDNYEKLLAYHDDKYKFYDYKQKDFSAYANKYCIYWYRYERNYKLEYVKDGNNDEYNFGKFLTDGWRRIDITDDKDNILLNFGLPRDEKLCVDENGKPWYDTDGNPINSNAKKYYSPKSLAQTVSRIMDRNLLEEKYMAVLFYNHEMFKSNVIIFTNNEPELIPNDALLDQRDALKIEHDVASQEHYQVYNEFNQLKSLEDGGKVRQLKCFYDGLFKKDEALINAGLYWYIPNHSTMLTFDKEFLIKEGFSTDADQKTDRSIEGYTYFYKKIGSQKILDKNGKETGEFTCNDPDRYFFYKIKPSLEKTALNNTILVKAYLEDVEYPVEGDITMTFSTFGTNGTKYTLTLVPSTSQAAVIGKDNPLQLRLMLKDNQNNEINIVDSTQVSDEDAYGLKIESWNNLQNAFTVTNIFDDDKKPDYIKGLKVSLTEENIKNWKKENPYFGIINAKVSFRMAKEYPQFEKENGEEDTQSVVSEYQKYKVVDLNTLYAIPYSSSHAYYMNGATNIVYNNQGTISYVSEDEYKLYVVNDKGNEPVKDQAWHIEYYDKTGRWINEETVNPDGSKPWDMLVNYMPVLNSENRLTPAPLYIEGLEYIPVVICTVPSETDASIRDYAWIQPIIITQNRYASSTLNDWNGSLTIDKKNGTILSTAVGAGKKETDNSFSGVLMGDIGKGLGFDPDNMSGLGLYGFNFGSQSFCLSVDGKAFFGKAGRGRIYIDGDKGTIASASYEAVRRDSKYSESAGMLIDLDDGYIHMLGSANADGAYSPDHPTGSTAQADVLISTGLMDGQKAPYFRIRSKKQSVKDHYLIYIDEDKYYLQTDDYKEWTYNETDTSDNTNFNGAGLKLDLQNGALDAYNFQLSSKNIYMNSTKSTSAFFIIKDDAGVNLFYAGPNDYYLKSSDYTPMSNTEMGSGIRLNLMNKTGDPSGIEAYNFDLRAGSVGVSGDQSHAIVLSDSGDPYFMVNTNLYSSDGTTITGKKTLVNISKTEQSFQSSDYAPPSGDTKGNGIRLSLSGKELKAYSGFQLKAYADSNNYIEINADPNVTYPLRVTNNFRVSWDGTVNATGGTFTNINAIGGTFSGNISVEGTFSGGTIVGASIYAANLYAGGSGQIGGSYIFQATPSGVTINGASISGSGSGGSYGMGTNGHLDAVSAEMTDLTVNNIIVKKSAEFLESCSMHIEGQVGINWNPVAGLDLIANGNICAMGKIGIGTWPSDSYLLYVSGGSSNFTGTVGIGSAPNNAYYLTVGTRGIYTNGSMYIAGGAEDLLLAGVNLPTYLDNEGYLKDSIDWNNITNKPTTFTPKSHDHTGTNHRHKITINGVVYYTEYQSMVLSGP